MPGAADGRRLTPLGDAEFAALMAGLGPFGAGREVAVGVSGGADSMALAWLMSRWGRPLACIVDHGLRPESAAEAAQAAERLAGFGVPSRILRADLVRGPALAERARTARYALLSQACAEAGCPDLALAHHAHDQAETLRLRLAAGSGPAGCAGMAGLRYLDALRVLRPFLAVPAPRLRATLQHAGIGWAEDPSNRDPATPRARLRQTMTEAEIAADCQATARYGRRRREAEQADVAELARVSIYPGGFAVAPEDLSPTAAASLLWCLSGRDYPPGPAALRPGTRHGVAVRPAGRLGPGVLLLRETAAMAPAVEARCGACWDGRFLLRIAVPGGTMGALGPDAARFRSRSGLPSAVLRTLPALRIGQELHAVPHLHFPECGSWHNLVRFAPGHALAGAPFAVGPG